MSPEDLRQVVLLDLPVGVWARAQEQTDALLREFALIAGAGEKAHEVPRRLTELVTALDHRFAGQTTSQEEQLYAAADAGAEVIPELRYLLPVEAGKASADLAALFDEADAFCRQGKHLLTLAPDDDVVLLRSWCLEQFVSQIDGGPAVGWTAWLAQRGGPTGA